jgi:acetoin utilization protein AcuB
MLRDASPSVATSLSIWELNYIIAKMVVEDIMVKAPITISSDRPIEEAIWLGKEKGIGAFPVVENGNLVGIITESDIAGVVSDALGLGEKDSKRITIDGSGLRFGFLKKLVGVLDSHRIPILSIMSVPKSDNGEWFLILRVKAKEAELAVEDWRNKGFNVTDVT